jgi:hypothetical protein
VPTVAVWGLHACTATAGALHWHRRWRRNTPQAHAPHLKHVLLDCPLAVTLSCTSPQGGLPPLLLLLLQPLPTSSSSRRWRRRRRGRHSPTRRRLAAASGASLPAPAAEEGLPRQCGTAALCPRRSGGQKAWTAELAQQAENSPLTCRPVPAPDVQPWTHPLTQSHDTRTAGQRPKGNRPFPSAAAVPPYCRDRPQGFCLCLLCFLLPPPLQVRLAADQQQSRRPRAPS